jgi:hypothetical protein
MRAVGRAREATVPARRRMYAKDGILPRISLVCIPAGVRGSTYVRINDSLPMRMFSGLRLFAG